MDFFGQQDRAQASTKRLVILFVLAVAVADGVTAGKLRQLSVTFGGPIPAFQGTAATAIAVVSETQEFVVG